MGGLLENMTLKYIHRLKGLCEVSLYGGDIFQHYYIKWCFFSRALLYLDYTSLSICLSLSYSHGSALSQGYCEIRLQPTRSHTSIPAAIYKEELRQERCLSIDCESTCN